MANAKKFYKSLGITDLLDEITEHIIMSFLLPRLRTKCNVDDVITSTKDVVLVLRFGRESDIACLQLDDIVRVEFLRI